MPGFDFAANSLSNDCAALMPDEAEGLGACEFWMHNTTDPQLYCDCSKFKNPVLRMGCYSFLTLSWDNPTVTYEEVICPPELSSLPCWEDNFMDWPFPSPELCMDPFPLAM